ncbi:unnamed protein product [Timema podura]|uniref:Uncharacterized protein n=1 Tax=Timema podura TaxID=61482 RepID=A0ABN7NKA1_TIMPD|nr:unnamed protein product [Timema podura]
MAVSCLNLPLCAFSSHSALPLPVGRIHHALGNTSQAVAYLQQGLQIAEHLGRREEEARIRHRLGLALWGHGDLEGSQCQLERAAHLLETIRREARGSSDYKLSLFDLQTVSYQALQVKNNYICYK